MLRFPFLSGILRGDAGIVTVDVLIAASQAEQEAAASTTVYVSPGRQKFHPGSVKAWVTFNGTGTVGIGSSYNVTSITDNGVGDYTVNFTTAFSSASYGYAGLAGTSAATFGKQQVKGGTPPTTTAFRFMTVDGVGAGSDEANISLSFYGDQ